MSSKFICDKCNKSFGKSGYKKHIERKTPCGPSMMTSESSPEPTPEYNQEQNEYNEYNKKSNLESNTDLSLQIMVLETKLQTIEKEKSSLITMIKEMHDHIIKLNNIIKYMSQ